MSYRLSLLPSPEHYSNWKEWATRLSTALRDAEGYKASSNPQVVLMASKIGGGNLGVESASQQGLLMFDVDKKCPTFSADDTWVPVDMVSVTARLDALEQSSLAQGSAVTAISPSGTTISYGMEFASPPKVMCTVVDTFPITANEVFVPRIGSITATTFTAAVTRVDSAYSTPVTLVSRTIHWLAIGQPA